MNVQQPKLRIAIIGAGLSGLVCAKQLSHIANVTVFEKSRGVSGRLATRRTEHSRFDHGAMGFNADLNDSSPFTAFVTEMLERSVIGEWPAKRAIWSNNNLAEDHQNLAKDPYYVGLPNMNAIGKHLACNLDIQLNTRVAGIIRDGAWLLTDNHDNSLGHFDWVICSAPPAQAAALLPRSFEHSEKLDGTFMQPCLSLMLSSIEDPTTPPFGYIQAEDDMIDTIIVNSEKPLRVAHNSIVVQSTPQWAVAHWQDDRNQVADAMLKRAEKILGMSLVNYQQALHGWLYAKKASGIDENAQPAWVDHKRKMIACGDWCLDGTVEGAFNSGLAAAQAVQQQLAS